jgi:hypothetical protein
VENHAKYADSIYFHDDHNLYVNLFIASELNWKDKGLRLSQQTSYPETAATELQFTCEKPVEVTLQLRHPFWATAGFEVRINGVEQPTGDSGSYVKMTRTWKTGDRVAVKMPFHLRIEAFRDNPNRFAVMYGPLVLCARIDVRHPFPGIVADEPVLLASLKPVAGKANTFIGPPNIFRVPGQEDGQEVTLAPFYQAYNEHYVTYWDRFTPGQWTTKQEEYKQEMAAQKELEARTVDSVRAGEEQNERDHNFHGEQTDTREFNDRMWRIAETNGWFSWDLKIEPNRAQELQVDFGGRRNANAALVLTIDGTKLVPQPRNANSTPGAPRTSLYALPSDLVKGKQKVTLKFQAPDDGRGGAVAGARVVRTEPDK